MKRTRASLLLVMVVIGFVVGLFAQLALASAGRPGVVPPVTLAIVLAAIGGIVVALAVPIRRSVKGSARSRVDPFYALRVLVLAKASALSGGLLAGVGVGFIVYLLTRSVPALGSIGYSIGMAVGAVLLLAGGLIAEELCRVPPADDDDDDKETVPAPS
ncbi:uncharacterized protein DUF3180 [Homoserinimonas aerilata]|uniref:Uncharacterized protein DUF3180 n=1 Tax=Homoserinimonas aerilata TaxID=1162970 RepID=A0A542Y1N1_9MICO|nr:DUF3180 domain-containing protein [Homoserinimonas aerilata]TQL41982.1 uncharacterized protein DUF3180 [Homoserinimonas aerilata]